MGRLALCVCVLLSCCIYQNDVNAMQGRSVDTIAFTVYHRDTFKDGQGISPTTASVNTFRNFRSKTVVIVHDVTNDGLSRFHATLKHAFLTNEDVSVLVVDWGMIAAGGINTAILQAQAIGDHIASLIRLLVARNQISLSQLHLVGFGVGAHIVGFTSRSLNRAARITALDPIPWLGAGSLSASDANYVEVIHTDIPTGTGSEASGTEALLGVVDFFPNGGNAHPGCGTDHECRHNRAWQFLAASLTDGGLFGNDCQPSSIWGIQPSDVTFENCNGYTIAMGGNDMVKFADGAFYLETSGLYPFKETCINTCSAPIGP